MDFVDTNVLLYAASTASEEKEKAEIARALLEREDLCLSVQVLQEFYVQATRAGKPDAMMHDQAILLVESFLRYPAQEVTVSLMKAAFATKRRFRISYWDAAIIEAARALGSRKVLSEDLNDHQDYGGVVVENPFRSAGERAT